MRSPSSSYTSIGFEGMSSRPPNVPPLSSGRIRSARPRLSEHENSAASLEKGSGFSVGQWFQPFREFPVFVSGANRPSVGFAKEPNGIEFEELAEFRRMGSELTTLI